MKTNCKTAIMMLLFCLISLPLFAQPTYSNKATINQNTNDSTAYIEQGGEDNTATTTQLGNNNDAWTIQHGEDNTASQRQEGNDNNANKTSWAYWLKYDRSPYFRAGDRPNEFGMGVFIHQIGDHNTANQVQRTDDSMMNVYVNKGDHNTVTQVQNKMILQGDQPYSVGTSNEMYSYLKNSNNNTINQTQTGSFNFSQIVTSNADNSDVAINQTNSTGSTTSRNYAFLYQGDTTNAFVRQTQTGTNARMTAWQKNNSADRIEQAQSGTGNNAVAHQDQLGNEAVSGNSIRQTQNGVDGMMYTLQYGDTNVAYAIQHDDSFYSTVYQYQAGVDNNSSITQGTGSYNSVTSLQFSGDANISILQPELGEVFGSAPFGFPNPAITLPTN